MGAVMEAAIAKAIRETGLGRELVQRVSAEEIARLDREKAELAQAIAADRAFIAKQGPKYERELAAAAQAVEDAQSALRAARERYGVLRYSHPVREAHERAQRSLGLARKLGSPVLMALRDELLDLTDALRRGHNASWEHADDAPAGPALASAQERLEIAFEVAAAITRDDHLFLMPEAEARQWAATQRNRIARGTASRASSTSDDASE